jgi:mycobactin lysine-N-oxygenase
VVGAGPKGIAIAAKARALGAVGLPAPRVVLVDRGEVAGNWSGRQGYTSGLLPLGTPPEKDVGYPYAAGWGDVSADVVAAMAAYSWQRHLIKHGAYGDWVDRGRMRPTHRQWSGFPNLSCLGLLSDRILRRYVAVNDAPPLISQRREHA